MLAMAQVFGQYSPGRSLSSLFQHALVQMEHHSGGRRGKILVWSELKFSTGGLLFSFSYFFILFYFLLYCMRYR